MLKSSVLIVILISLLIVMVGVQMYLQYTLINKIKNDINSTKNMLLRL